MITKNINQIAAQYERIWKLHFKYDKGTEKMWQKVEEICGKFLCETSLESTTTFGAALYN